MEQEQTTLVPQLIFLNHGKHVRLPGQDLLVLERPELGMRP